MSDSGQSDGGEPLYSQPKSTCSTIYTKYLISFFHSIIVRLFFLPKNATYVIPIRCINCKENYFVKLCQKWKEETGC